MKLGSLCSGYGGLDLAVEAHYGATTVWHAETDKDCAKVLAHHWPAVPNLGDLTVVDWGQVEPVDVLAAGYPCQPYSHAGHRKGEDDERAIFAWIADAVSVLRPRVCVFENVSGHLSKGGTGVIATLTGLGYDTRWGVVRASDAGAAHRRARWFCVARSADSSSQRYGSREIGRGVGQLDRRDESQTRQQQRARAEPVDRDSETFTDADLCRFKSIRPGGELEEANRGPCPSHRFGPYGEAVARWERVLGRPAPEPTDNRGLRPEFVSWLMGLPAGYITSLGLSRTAELKMLGNGCMVQQAALGLEILDDQR